MTGLTNWFPTSRRPSRTGWYDFKGKMMSGVPWPNRMWYDADNDRWRPKPFDILIYHPDGPPLKNSRWRGQVKR